MGGGGKKARRYRYRYLKRYCTSPAAAPPPTTRRRWGAEVEREGRWRSPSVPLHPRPRVPGARAIDVHCAAPSGWPAGGEAHSNADARKTEQIIK